MSVKQTVLKPTPPQHSLHESIQEPINESSHEAATNNLESLKQLHIARELADVTWRIAVPVIGLSVLGIIADRSWGSRPWLTLLGSVAGFVIAGWLVHMQIKRVTAEEERRAS